ncbi:ABC transporter ATP-binding protein [Georgenia sp. SUBG003]|uniref:ABC transporter ATP-binding protein n=1 Tax=Georgenia sp. SUBG003 TaxID=1497974 RepID=UPI003AB76CA7
MGPSGSGKSTLLHCLAGVVSPTSGEVVWRGRPIGSLPDAARTALRRTDFGFVFQSGQLLPELPADENAALPLMLRGVSRPDAVAAARAWLHRLGLRGMESRRPGELSGGQAQRVAIARAMAASPRRHLRRRADRRPGPGLGPRGAGGPHGRRPLHRSQPGRRHARRARRRLVRPRDRNAGRPDRQRAPRPAPAVGRPGSGDGARPRHAPRSGRRHGTALQAGCEPLGAGGVVGGAGGRRRVACRRAAAEAPRHGSRRAGR